MNRSISLTILAVFGGVLLFGETAAGPSGPAIDRVGFPEGYQKFAILRSINRAEKGQIVTIYGNDLAASIQSTNNLPYPNGSVIVMETAEAQKGADSKPSLDEHGHFLKGKVAGLHVMRRGKDFGEAYGTNRSGNWEYVEYRADRSYITPPQKSSTCASCDIKAGSEKDFVYGARFAAAAK